MLLAGQSCFFWGGLVVSLIIGLLCFYFIAINLTIGLIIGDAILMLSELAIDLSK